MTRSRRCLALLGLMLLAAPALAQGPNHLNGTADPRDKEISELKTTLAAAQKDLIEANGKIETAQSSGDTAWMLASSAFVMFMLPGLALFYGGMVRRKNVLATMMQSMACLAVVGLYWVAVGYGLAFGPSAAKVSCLGIEDGGILGWSWDLFFLKGIDTATKLPNATIPVYVHVMFQGMFAIITPALISGAVAERIRFLPFCLFCILWVTFVYCPLAHMVWAFDWFYDVPLDGKQAGATAIGLLGKMGALDFAGGTVVHIAAGMAGLAACLVLRRRDGYPKTVSHPNSMVLTLLGAGFLWFGWFGFNGGSAGAAGPLAGSAFAATQAAAAAAGVGWMLIEWVHKGKPTALGLASGIVAGLVAVTPASGYVFAWGGAAIGLAAAAVCYLAVSLKGLLRYDDSLDAFGVHGVGGFVGAVLTGLFCSTLVNPAGGDGPFTVGWQKDRIAALESKLVPDAKKAAEGKEAADSAAKKAAGLEDELKKLRTADEKRATDQKSSFTQLWIQTKAAGFSVVFAFAVSAALAFLTHLLTLGRFTTDKKAETDGLDRTEHGEVGFDFGYATESITLASAEPRAASYPKGNGRYQLAIEGAKSDDLMHAWTALCQPTEGPVNPDFKVVYPHVTTVSGNTFRFRGGDANLVAGRLESLFKKLLPGKPVKVTRT